MPPLHEIENFSRHVILYSKDWYGKTHGSRGSVHYIDDLKALLCKYAALDTVSRDDVFQLVVLAFVQYVKPHEMREALGRLFVWKGEVETVTIHELVESMLGKLSVIKIQGCYQLDMTLLPIRFGDKVKELETSHATLP